MVPDKFRVGAAVERQLYKDRRSRLKASSESVIATFDLPHSLDLVFSEYDLYS
jgi:hypothetical protein